MSPHKLRAVLEWLAFVAAVVLVWIVVPYAAQP